MLVCVCQTVVDAQGPGLTSIAGRAMAARQRERSPSPGDGSADEGPQNEDCRSYCCLRPNPALYVQCGRDEHAILPLLVLVVVAMTRPEQDSLSGMRSSLMFSSKERLVEEFSNRMSKFQSPGVGNAQDIGRSLAAEFSSFPWRDTASGQWTLFPLSMWDKIDAFIVKNMMQLIRTDIEETRCICCERSLKSTSFPRSVDSLNKRDRHHIFEHCIHIVLTTGF